MPNTRRWRGNAPAVAQVVTVEISHVENGVTLALINGGKTVSIVADGTDAEAAMADLVDAWNDAIEPQFSEITAAIVENESALTLTADNAGVPFDLTATQSGTGGNSEVKTVTINNSPTGGTWSWVDSTYGTSSGLAYNISAANLQIALRTLYGSVGSPSVSGSAGGPYTVTFDGALAHTDIPDTTFTNTSLTGGNATVSVVETVKGSAGTSEVQTITFYGSPSGGTWTATFNGFTTSALAYNISTANLQTALRALTSIGSTGCTVGGSAGAWVVTFAGTLASTAVPMITVDTTGLTGGTIFGTIATTTPGVAGISEQQLIVQGSSTGHDKVFKLSRSGTVSGGTFRLSHNGNYTSTIAYDAKLYEILSALETRIATDEGALYRGPYFAPFSDETTYNDGNAIMSDTSGYFLIRATGFWGQANLDSLYGSTKGGDTLTLGIDSASLTGGGSYVFPDTTYINGLAGSTLALSGTVNFSFGGQTTSNLTYTAPSGGQVLTSPTAAALQSALEGLSTIGTGNVSVTAVGSSSVASAPIGTSRGCFVVTFQGALAGTPLSELTCSIVSGLSSNTIETITMRQGVAGTNEVQTVTLSGTPAAGTFTLTYDGQTTSDIAYNASAATVDAALEALSNIDAGAVTCTGGALPGSAVTVTFTGSLQYTNVNALIINDNKLKSSVVETTPGVTATNEIQTISLTGSPHGGTCTLTYNAHTTGTIAYNADAATVQAALEALSDFVPGDVVCTGGPWPAAIACTFGAAFAAMDVSAITGTGTGLNNGTVTSTSVDPIIYTVTTANSGPGDVSVAANWSGETLPVAGDTIVVDQGTSPMLYHLDQLATGLAAFYHYSRYTGEIGLAEINTSFGTPYYEFRQQYLTVDSPIVDIGIGDGAGSGRMKIQGVVGTAVTVNVNQTANSLDEGIPSLLLVLPNTSSIVNVNRGSVGIAIYPGETSTVPTLRTGFITNKDGDSNVRCGTGVTLTTVEIAGGVTTLQSNVTTLNETAGEVLQLAGAITTANVGAGSILRYRSASTMTTAVIGPGATLDCRQDMRAKTITNLTLNTGAKYYDPHGVVTLTNGIIFTQCGPNDCTLEVKPGYKWTPS